MVTEKEEKLNTEQEEALTIRFEVCENEWELMSKMSLV